jgi:hypothetical protein
MSLTPEARRLHNEYAEAERLIQSTVDDAYTAVRQLFEKRGFDVSNNDPAEELVAHIYKYLIDSAENPKYEPLPCPYCPFGHFGYTIPCSHCGRCDTPQEPEFFDPADNGNQGS